MKVTIHLFNSSSTDNPDGQVGLGKGHLALLPVLLPLLVVVDLVLAHIYPAWAAIVTAIPGQDSFFKYFQRQTSSQTCCQDSGPALADSL